MKCNNVLVSGILAVLIAGLWSGLGGCTNLVLNQIEVRAGSITIVFNNETPFQAAFSYGSWDAWDRTPGPLDFQQLRLSANSISDAATIGCGRDFAIGTQDFVERAIATEADLELEFDAEAFDTVVRFSRAPDDSDAGALPTEGTAVGIHLKLGVDYSCVDEIIVTFVQDPDSPGGFRTDYEVILDENRDD